MREKLSKPRLRLLEDIAAGDDGCVKVYAPANWLTVNGFAEWFDDDEYGGRLRLLPAGRAALNEARDD